VVGGEGIMNLCSRRILATYYFSFLRRGPNDSLKKTPETGEASSRPHGEHQRHAKTGRAGDSRGHLKTQETTRCVVFKVGSLEKQRRWLNRIRTVKAGRLVAETPPWMVAQVLALERCLQVLRGWPHGL